MLDIDELLSEETVSEEKETSVEPVADLPAKPKRKPAKKKMKPRGGNSPVIGNNGLMLEEGDNTKFLSVQLELYNMKNIDMNNVEEVQQRLGEYFELYGKADMKPTVAGMAIALNGHNRRWLWAVTHDQPLGGRGNEANLRPEVTDTIKKAYFMLENLWETYMNSGKVNPVAGIFLGKNNYDYQDKTECVLTPNTNNDNDYNAEQIRSRYASTMAQLPSSDSDTDSTD